MTPICELKRAITGLMVKELVAVMPEVPVAMTDSLPPAVSARRTVWTVAPQRQPIPGPDVHTIPALAELGLPLPFWFAAAVALPVLIAAEVKVPPCAPGSVVKAGVDTVTASEAAKPVTTMQTFPTCWSGKPELNAVLLHAPAAPACLEIKTAALTVNAVVAVLILRSLLPL